jgi:hypothetical protein
VPLIDQVLDISVTFSAGNKAESLALAANCPLSSMKLTSSMLGLKLWNSSGIATLSLSGSMTF